jgi:hypothetical protein
MKESLAFDETKEETEEIFAGKDKDAINVIYKKIKEDKFIKSLIDSAGKLKIYHKNFENLNDLKLNFIFQEPGINFNIFAFSSLDLKLLWSNRDIKVIVKKYILTILHHFYKNTFEIYKTITSPDVDIERFTEVLMASIAEIKKNPELHRCKNAFRKIEESVQLLHNKFEEYYRDSIYSKNINIIMENFINDVSRQGGHSPALLREFRIIINYMKKASHQTGRDKDPNIKKLFNYLGDQFKMMENQGVDVKTDEPNTMGNAEIVKADKK